MSKNRKHVPHAPHESRRGAVEGGSRIARIRAAVTASLTAHAVEADTAFQVLAATQELADAQARAKGLNKDALALYELATKLPGYERKGPVPAYFNIETREFEHRDWLIGFDSGSGEPHYFEGISSKILQFPAMVLPDLYLGHNDVVPVHYCFMSSTETPEGVTTLLTLNGRPRGIDQSGSSSSYPRFGSAISISIGLDGTVAGIGRDSSHAASYASYVAADTNIGMFLEQVTAGVQQTIDFSTQL